MQNIVTTQVEQRVGDRIAQMERVASIKSVQIPLPKVTLEHLSDRIIPDEVI